MNIIRAAKQTVAEEHTALAKKRQQKEGKGAGSKSKHIQAVFKWVAEASESTGTVLKAGDKVPLTDEEKEFYQKTPYERGVEEYEYDGFCKPITHPFEMNGDPRQFLRDGNGLLKYPHGQLYDGAWRQNKRCGKGIYSNMTGYRYVGEFSNDLMHGKGEELFAPSLSLSAGFERGMPSGEGKLFYLANGKSNYHYEGEFSEGRRHGKGTIFYDNGDTFVGEFKNGRRHGKGITTNANGRQYETNWEADKLVGPVWPIEKGKRTARPTSDLTFDREQCIIPADLTRWQVREDATELSEEHFFRIKMGFEGLDKDANGSLSTKELARIWPGEGLNMLKKLDKDRSGTVEIDEIFGGWYPNVPEHNISRFIVLDIDPKTLFRLRGFLAGIEEEFHQCGYFHIVGAEDRMKKRPKTGNPELDDEYPDTDSDDSFFNVNRGGDDDDDDDGDSPPLSLPALEAAGYRIGGEKFTNANYNAAQALNDPPDFVDVLSVWYPNAKRLKSVDRVEITKIPPDTLDQIRKDWFEMTDGNFDIAIERFAEARAVWQSWDDGKKKGEPSNAVEKKMEKGFFRGQPTWRVGPVAVTVKLLEDIDAYDSSISGTMTLHALLRYAYPNVRCYKMQELLTGKQVDDTCECCICNIK